MTPKYLKLKTKLQELFQLDQPDLDFGLYRVMHAKSAEVSQFLDKDLLPQVQATFGQYKTADKAEIEKELAKAVEQAQDLGADPETLPKVKELRGRLANDAVDIGALESEVYDHLFSFFRRYYDQGDFLAKRVYKPGVYAIPYEGEEVTLHWANKDQYYIKTSEYLRDYAFRLRPQDDNRPMRVHFRLADAAEGEHGNVKAAEGKDRVFILAAPGESGRDFMLEENGEQGKELVIRFEYRPASLADWPEVEREDKKKPPTQKDLSALAAKRVLAVTDVSLVEWIVELGKSHVTVRGEKVDYTRLEAHLRRYTARNTFDYFIHKDLGTFLRRELDFYIKNEVMHLDDVESETAPRVEQYLSKIKVIRKIAGKIIAFLAQLEDFQKKLWLKKKFVVETQWCITVGCIPEAFYPEIAASEAQHEEWVKLGFVPGNAGILPASPVIAGKMPTLPGTGAPSTTDLFTRSGPHKGYYTRGYLPHFDAETLIQAITFRLHDSVPATTIAQWKEELHWTENSSADSKEAIALRKKIEQFEDAGHGACYLRDETIAALVKDAFKHFDGERYTLIAWCIMPNHVHVLIETRPEHPLYDVVQAWKSFTAKEANKHLKRQGVFWMPDYFDRYIRDEKHYQAAIEYIVQNPVKAGLVGEPGNWPWSGVVGGGDGDVGGGRDARVPGDFLKAHPTLVVDTRHFDADFTARLLEAMGDVDEQTDGVLFHSENFQALSLMQTRYREKVKCIYIDPPYNTDASAIAYKNDYKDSSWLALLENRLVESKNCLRHDGVSCIAIDDTEFAKLKCLVDALFKPSAILGVASVRSNPSGRSTPKGFAEAHEYALFIAASESAAVGRIPRNERQRARYDEHDDIGPFEWVNFRKHGGREATREARPRMYYPVFAAADGSVRLPRLEWNPASQRWSLSEQPQRGEVTIWPVRDADQELRWKWGPESFSDCLRDFCARPDQSGNIGVYMKSRMNEEGMLPVTWWDDKEYSATEYGTNLLTNMFGRIADFSFPKALKLVIDCIRSASVEEDSTVLDFFAGSGTTGHAVINLNREDGGRRKFILVEMGEYFDTVLLPRIKKVTYTPEWRDGNPKRLATPEESERSPRIVKVVRLESYEDTLNNLETRRTETQQSLLDHGDAQGADGLKEQYILRYLLDVETRGSQSLLNVQAFTDPTAYKLKVKRPGSDESREVNVDLLETFNWLIGLTVKHIAAPQTFSAAFERDSEKRLRLNGHLKQEAGGPYWFRTVTRTTPDGRRTLIIWRNCPGNAGVPPAAPSSVSPASGRDGRVPGVEQDNLVLDEWFKRQDYTAKDSEFDLIYINGGNNLENLKTPDDQWKVRLIEEHFHRLMFESEGV